MKNKEEPSIDLSRGSVSSLSRPGRTAAAQIEQPALSGLSESLLEAVVAEANLERAWKNVKANRGAPGPDGVTIGEFPAWFRTRWPTIRQQLLDGTYRPGPVRRKTIDKPDGGKRQLGIPNVLDRLIQQAIVQVLTPVFDPHFSDSSYGFRPKRSAHGAAKQVQRIIRHGYRFAVDMDLSKFFDQAS
jgi:RNA-directed DNA polymerase